LNERLVYYDQFRKRYAANLEVLDRYEDPDGGVEVEVCNEDGEWFEGKTTGQRRIGRRVTVPVRFLCGGGGGERDVSIGMIICSDASKVKSSGSRSDRSDLTKSRGRSNKELLEEHRKTQREAATANGKDYCKASVRRTVHAGGITFVCGGGAEKKKKRDHSSDSEEDSAHAAKRKRHTEQSREEKAKMQAIMDKYCVANRIDKNAGRCGSDAQDGSTIDRMRLG